MVSLPLQTSLACERHSKKRVFLQSFLLYRPVHVYPLVHLPAGWIAGFHLYSGTKPISVNFRTKNVKLAGGPRDADGLFVYGAPFHNYYNAQQKKH